MYKGPMVSKETKENSCKIMFWFFFYPLHNIGAYGMDQGVCQGSQRQGCILTLEMSWKLQLEINTYFCQCGRPGLSFWVGTIPWRRTWQPTIVFLPGESPWMDEPGRLQSIGWQRVGHNRMPSL